MGCCLAVCAKASHPSLEMWVGTYCQAAVERGSELKEILLSKLEDLTEGVA